MKCDEMKDLILTDYLDGRLSLQKKKEVDAHLATCTGCSEFLSLAQKSAVNPLLSTRTMELNENVIWNNLKNRIIDEKIKTTEPSGIRQLNLAIKRFLTQLNPLAIVMSVFIVVAILNLNTDNPDLAQNSWDEEIGLVTIDDDLSNEGYGTEIEQYFL